MRDVKPQDGDTVLQIYTETAALTLSYGIMLIRIQGHKKRRAKH